MSEKENYLFDSNFESIDQQKKLNEIQTKLLAKLPSKEEVFQFIYESSSFNPEEIVVRGHHIRSHLLYTLKNFIEYKKIFEQSKTGFQTNEKILRYIAQIAIKHISLTIKNEKSIAYIEDYFGDKNNIKELTFFTAWFLFAFIALKKDTKVIMTTKKDLVCTNCAVGEHCTQKSQVYKDKYLVDDLEYINSILEHLETQNKKIKIYNQNFIISLGDFREAIIEINKLYLFLPL